MDLLSDALAQGITPAIVVVIYLIAVKVIDNKREHIQAKLNSELVSSISKISSFITDITKNTIQKDKEKCKIAINDSINCSAYALIKFVADTLVNNHIDINKETIIINIKNIVNAEYYNIYTILNIYEINGIKVSELLKKEWIEEVEKAVTDSIYNNALNKEEKIMSFSNKINLKFQSYITYIINNAIKGGHVNY